MKKIKFLAMMIAAFSFTMGFTACGDDDDDTPDSNLWVGELGAPAYEADAVAYRITNSSDYSAIELTASGNYIVTPAALAQNNAPAARRSMFKAMAKEERSSRAGNYNGVFGTYTKLSDGSYNLKGFGVLSPYSNGSLTLTLENGTTEVLDAVKVADIESNPLNNRFCRTWYLQSAEISVYDRGGNLIDRETITGSGLKDDYVQYVVVTKAGTFVQVDWNGMIESNGEWAWVSTADQIFSYRFLDEYDDFGSVQVAFDNDRAYYQASFEEYDDDYGQYVIYVERLNTIAR